jgi:DNA modification methylase
MQIEQIAIGRLCPADYNPRKALMPGDAAYEKLKRSLSAFGFVEPLVWNKTTGNVVGGHQRLAVLKDLGYAEADCVVVELDAQKEKALNVALNRIQGEWDDGKLAAVLESLDAAAFDVSLTGFDTSEIDGIMGDFYAKAAVEDSFDTDKAAEEIRAKGAAAQPGDIWQLGPHRLMCGDSTSEDDIRQLLTGERAQMAVTSPPYGVGKDYEKKGIGPWLETMKPVIKNVTKYADVVCWNLGDLYPTGTQFIEPTNFYSAGLFADNGFRPIWIRIWKKPNLNFCVSPYHLVTTKPVQQYELISAFGKQTEPEYNDQEYVWLSAYAGHAYKFVKRLTREERKKWGYAGIWEMNTVKSNKAHPAMFPVELPWRCIKMHSDTDGIVLEPFCGSGTTVIACEQTGRRCFALEKEPAYVDLAVKRWQEFTGRKAVRLC